MLDKLKKLLEQGKRTVVNTANRASNFVRQNPTPAGYVKKQIQQRVVNPTINRINNYNPNANTAFNKISDLAKASNDKFLSAPVRSISNVASLVAPKYKTQINKFSQVAAPNYTPKTNYGKVGQSIGRTENFITGAVGQMLIPGVGEVKALNAVRPLAKALGYTALRSGEGAAWGGLQGAADTGDWKGVKKGAITGAVMGGTLNTLLSPKAVKAAVKDVGAISRYHEISSKINAEVPKSYTVESLGKNKIANINYAWKEMNPKVKYTKLPDHEYEFLIENDRLPNRGEAVSKRYDRHGGTVEVAEDAKTGALLSVKASKPEFSKYLESWKPKKAKAFAALPGSDALSNEAKLIEEAKKYKTPDEFVKAKTNAYHGTPNKEFDRFELGKGTNTENETNGLGVWTTNNEKAAKVFSNKIENGMFGIGSSLKDVGGTVIPVHTKLKNPKIYTPNKGSESLLEEIASLEKEKIPVTRMHIEDDYLKVVEMQKKNKEINAKISDLKKQYKRDSFENFMDDRDQFAEYIQEGAKWQERYAANNVSGTNKKFIEYLKKQGHDGIIIKNTEYDAGRSGSPTIDQILSFNPEDTLTRKQLTEIWKQSQLSPQSTQGATPPLSNEAKGIKVYHGTGANFDAFDDSMRGSVTGAKSANGAIWFTDDPATAKAYAINAAEDGPLKALQLQMDDAERIAQKSGSNKDWAKYDALVQKQDDLGSYDNTYERRNNAIIKQSTIKEGNFLTINAKGKTPQELSAAGDIDSWLNQQLDNARLQGKDGVKFTNLNDAVGLDNRPSTHYAIFDSKNASITGTLKHTDINGLGEIVSPQSTQGASEGIETPKTMTSDIDRIMAAYRQSPSIDLNAVRAEFKNNPAALKKIDIAQAEVKAERAAKSVIAKRENEYGNKLNALANKTQIMGNDGRLNNNAIGDFQKSEYELAKQYPDIGMNADKIAYYEKTHPTANVGAEVKTLKTELTEPTSSKFIQDLEKSNTKLQNTQPKPTQAPQEILADDANSIINRAQFQATDKASRKGFLDIFDKWIGQKEVSKTMGAEATSKYNVPAGQAKTAISELENGLKNNKYATNIRQAYNDLFKVAETLGKDTKQEIAYRQNYLTHVWKNTPEQIDQAFAKLGKKFSFANPREFASYEEGIKAGLTPRYDNPAQMIGEYVSKIESTKANLGFFNDLKENGFIVPASLGQRAGFVPINAEGFPANSTSFAGQTYTGSWYAPKEIANEINKVFNPQDTGTVGKIFRTGAKISGGAQDILLSGGIPKTPINAFTIAQSTKELLSGRVKSPIVSMVRSLDRGTTQKFFADNVGSIKKMQERNIPIRTEFDIENVADKGWVKNTFGSSFGETWNKVVNTPTFKRFMPMLQINLFNDIERGALKAGKSASEAADVAGQAVKNFYGLGNTGAQVRANQLGKDIVSTALFAPRYRESMVNFWVNNVKSLYKNPLKLENQTNAKFLVGATATLVAMDQLNKAINGHGMSENPEGKTDKLLIPLGNGKTIGIPFLSSIATVPRMAYNTVKDLAQGDIKGAGKELKSNLSMSLRPIGDVLSNENYFGSEIYNENDTMSGKLKASANYLLNPVTGAYTHPYLREGIKYVQGKQGAVETLSKATELPIRWYKTSSIENAGFYAANDIQKQIDEVKKDAKYGKLNAETAQAQVQKLTDKQNKLLNQSSNQPQSTSDNRIKDLGGYFGVTTSKGTAFADTIQEANSMIAKEDLVKSGKSMMIKDGMVYRVNKNGEAQPAITELSYNTQLTTQKLENAKTAKNMTEWMKLAEQQEKNLAEQLQDPTLDELEKTELQQKYDKLIADAQKYAGYGGFTKGKSGGSGKTKKAKVFTIPSTRAADSATSANYKYLDSLLAGAASRPTFSTANQIGRKVALKKQTIKKG